MINKLISNGENEKDNIFTWRMSSFEFSLKERTVGVIDNVLKVF